MQFTPFIQAVKFATGDIQFHISFPEDGLTENVASVV
jgi:hypothetical protein